MRVDVCEMKKPQWKSCGSVWVGELMNQAARIST